MKTIPAGGGPLVRVPPKAVGEASRRRHALWRLTFALTTFAAMALPYVSHARMPEDSGRWAARYNGPGNSDDYADSVAVSPDGTKVFVTGLSRGSGTGFDYATAAYSSGTGAQLWAVRYNGPEDSFDAAYSIAVSPDSTKVFVTGQSLGSESSGDYLTVAYSSDSGSELWTARYNGPGNSGDFASSIAVSPDGTKVFVTGQSYGSGTDYDYATVAYSSGSGSQLWAVRYNGPWGSSDDVATSIAVSPDGSKVFVTGQSPGLGFTDNDYTTVAYSSGSGSELWAARYNGLGNSGDYATSIAVSPDGASVFVTGQSPGSATSQDYATVGYSSGSGSELWTARYNGPGNSSDYAYSIDVSPDGAKVFVTGQSDGSATSLDYATVAYSTVSGSQLWAARYNGPAMLDAAYAVAVSPDGTKVFVTGQSVGAGSLEDYATVAYSTVSGSQLWVARYNGPGMVDVAVSIAVSPDGANVFVTGYSAGSGTGRDYATVAYPTGTCANGKYENGPVSAPVHEHVEPLAGHAASTHVHGVNCEVFAGSGL